MVSKLVLASLSECLVIQIPCLKHKLMPCGAFCHHGQHAITEELSEGEPALCHPVVLTWWSGGSRLKPLLSLKKSGSKVKRSAPMLTATLSVRAPGEMFSFHTLHEIVRRLKEKAQVTSTSKVAQGLQQDSWGQPFSLAPSQVHLSFPEGLGFGSVQVGRDLLCAVHRLGQLMPCILDGGGQRGWRRPCPTAGPFPRCPMGAWHRLSKTQRTSPGWHCSTTGCAGVPHSCKAQEWQHWNHPRPCTNSSGSSCPWEPG